MEPGLTWHVLGQGSSSPVSGAGPIGVRGKGGSGIPPQALDPLPWHSDFRKGASHPMSMLENPTRPARRMTRSLDADGLLPILQSEASILVGSRTSCARSQPCY